MAIESHKNVFARLLACENIHIVHEQVHTASFDVKNRILSLPIWKDVSADVYDLLIAHEVGHALFTPSNESIEVGKKYGSEFFQNYLNPIEDLRVEKLIKQKYGGLRRQFSSGYGELWEKDFFGVEKFKADTGKPVNKMSILDRLHIYGKVGALSGIIFETDNDKLLLAQVEKMVTFDDAVELALLLFGNNGASNQNQNQNQNGEGEQNQNQNQNQNGEGEQNQNQNGEGEQNQNQNQNGEGEQNQNQNQNGEGEQNQNQNQNGEGEQNQNQNGEGFGKQASFDGCVTNVHSVSMLNDSLASLIDISSPSPKYATMPDFYFDGVVDVKDVLKDLSDFYKSNPNRASYNEYNEFKKSSKKVVNLMLKEFELKKRADEYRRATTSRTGVIDMKLLHKYRISEDIFSRNINTKDGKSHGFVSILDWSGSMSAMIIPTTEQLIVMAQFFKRANVPFEIFLFTDSHKSVRRFGQKTYNPPQEKLWFVELNKKFCLPNILSSRLNAKEFDAACLNLYNLAHGVASRYGRNQTNKLAHFDQAYPESNYHLGGTPLNESIVALKQIVKKFREDSGVHIVNTIIMTDGLASGICTSNSGIGEKNIFLVEGKENFGKLGTEALLKWLKYHTDSNIIGFYLIKNSSSIDMMYSPKDEKSKTDWLNHMKKYDFAASKIDGYDEHYTIRTSKVSVEDGFEVVDGLSDRTIGKEFINHMIERKKSRLLAERFVARIVF